LYSEKQHKFEELENQYQELLTKYQDLVQDEDSSEFEKQQIRSELKRVKQVIIMMI